MVDLRESLRPAGSVTPLPVSEIAARAGRRRRRRLATITAAALLATAGTATLIINTLPRSNAAIVAEAAESTRSTADRPGPISGAGTSTPATEPAGTETDSSNDTDTDADTAESASPGPVDSAPTDPTDTTPDPTGAGPTGTDSAASETEDPDAGSENDTPLTTPGLRTEATTTSRWEDGYCLEIEVRNDAETAAETWQVVLDLDGTIATLWSATVDDSAEGLFVFTGVDGYNATLGARALTTFGACLDVEPG